MSPVQHTPRHLVPPTIKRLACAALGALALMWAVSARAYPVLVLPNPGGTLKAVVPDASGTTAAQQVQGVNIAAGSTAQVNFAVVKQDGTAADLTGAQVLLTVKHSVTDANPLISRQATITTPATLGVGYFPLVITDTLTMRGVYQYDVFVTWPDGSRTQVVPSSAWNVTQAQGQPGQVVTVPSTQQPLAQGPQGFPSLVQNVSTLLTSRLKLRSDGTVVMSDDAVNQWTNLGLPSLGPGAGTQTLSTGETLTFDAQGRVTGISPTTRSILCGTGLTGCGTLALDRTLSVLYGTTSGTATAGNDARLPPAPSQAGKFPVDTGTGYASRLLQSTDLPASGISAGTYGGGSIVDIYGRLTAYDRQKAGVYNCRDYGAVGDGVTDDSTALQNCINDAVAHANTRIFIPPTVSGYAIGTTLLIQKALGVEFVGGGPSATVFKWIGSALSSAVMFNLVGNRRCYFGGFSLQGNGVTIGMKEDGYVGSPSNVASTLNTFERIVFDSGFSICIEIGAAHFQADQSTYRRLTFVGATVAGVSIEDSNAVLHDFYECTWQQCADGITAIRAGTGGSFNLYTCFFAGDTGWDISVYPSSRGTFVSAHAEGGAHFLRTATGSAATTVTCSGCSVNGMTDSTSLGAGLGSMMAFQSSGSVVISGGRFGCTYQGTTCSPQITIASNNNTRTNVLIDGATFESNPFQTTSVRLGSVVTRGIQLGFTGTASSSSAGWATVDGGVCRGTLSAPIALLTGGGNTLISAACGYVKIASGTTLSKGDNTYQITANNCQGSSRVDVRPISYGGVPAPVQIKGVDAGSNTMQVVVTVPAPFQLTSDMTFYASCNPEIWSIP